MIVYYLQVLFILIYLNIGVQVSRYRTFDRFPESGNSDFRETYGHIKYGRDGDRGSFCINNLIIGLNILSKWVRRRKKVKR